MKKTVLLLFTGICSITSMYAQTTSPLPYCYADFAFIGGDPVGSDWINSVKLGTLNNVSGAESPAPHYIFYNNLGIPNLSKDSSYTLSLNFSVGGGAGYAAWIDFNHNDVFDSAERVAGIVASTGMGLGSSVPVTATVTIPASALTGNTRMRVRIDEDDNYHGSHPGAYELACDSMNTTSYGGETEDYIVNIVPSLGVNEISKAGPFSLYPNPANNIITVSGALKDATVAIFDVQGREIHNFKIEGNNIDVSRVNAGYYFVHIISGDEVSVLPLYIQR